MLYSSSDGGAKAADADYCSDFECVVISFILDVRVVDVPAGATQYRRKVTQDSPPSSRGACLNFSREKDSAIPFLRRSWDRIGLESQDLAHLFNKQQYSGAHFRGGHSYHG